MKVYVKSATNVADIEANIAKKQAEIDKKQAWIAKKELAIQKKLDLLRPELSSEEYDKLVNYLELLKTTYSSKIPLESKFDLWGLARKNGWNYESPKGKACYSIDDDAESIYNSNYAIKEAQAILDKYNAQLAAIKSKDKEIDEIPDCLKDFMNEIIENWNDYDFNIKNNGKPFYRELRDKAWNILYGDASYGSGAKEKAKLEELYPDVTNSTWGDTYARRKKFDYDYITKPFEREFGSLKYAESIWGLSDEKIRSNNERDGKNLILDLLNRVTKITGPVRDWSGLHVTSGNSGGAVLNGIVIGEEGKARVESIYASGPVQRLHIRTLVKPIK